ncbi:MAG: LCP family protein [Lachnospiraceae bacterium]|nr:LCP family protein [Lachnospiraceae bacterium]
MSEQKTPVRMKPKKRPDIKMSTKQKSSKKRMPKWAKILMIVFMSLGILVLGLFIAYNLIFSHYYNKMLIVDADHPDITMAVNETLEPEPGDNDPSQSDSPSEEVAAIEDELARVMREYEQKMKESAGDTYYTVAPNTDPLIEDLTDPEDGPEIIEPINIEVPSDNGAKPASNPKTPNPGTPNQPADPAVTPNPGSSSGSNPGVKVAGSTGIYNTGRKAADNVGLQNGGAGDGELPQVGADPNVLNILLIGIDSRSDSNAGRSDTMIIMSINRNTKQIILTSLMRDCYVAIPGRGNNRLNAAHAYGGANLLMQTIEVNFGIHIDYFARVNFFSFMDIVDAVGGIDINLTAAELPHVNSASTAQNKIQNAGMNHLNGPQALAYARIRYVGSDYARTQRQRTVLQTVAGKLRGMGLGELNSFLNVALPKIATNIPQGVLNDLVWSMPSTLKYNISEFRVPWDGTGSSVRINGKSVLAVDITANRNLLNQIIYGR